MLDDDVEHEPVELGLGQRVGPLELDRVLGSEDEERLLQGIGPALDRDPVLLHRLEQGRLGLRRGPVDLVGEEHVREHRTRCEHHLAPAGRGVLLDDVGAGDVGGHQVGGELDARELQVQDLRHRLDDQRLGEPGHTDDEAVAADEQRQQGLVHDLLLADDLLADLGQDLLASRLHAVGQGDVVGIFEVGRLIGEFVHGGHSPRPRRAVAGLRSRCRRPSAAAPPEPARTRGRPAVQWVNAYMM